MKESKEARFRRVAEARVNKIIKMMQLLGNCSGTNVYGYTDSEVEQIFMRLQIELDKARLRYVDGGKPAKKRFSLSDTESTGQTPDIVSNPHITLPLPDGTSLRAVSYAQLDYPSINLYLLKDKEPAELICFAEFNQERNLGHQLCVGVYSSEEDDTKYYEPYTAERESADEYLGKADAM